MSKKVWETPKIRAITDTKEICAIGVQIDDAILDEQWEKYWKHRLKEEKND